jgi:Protein of unknown function (DUF3467)
MPEAQVSFVNPMQFARSQDFRDIYSNFVRIGVTGSDISVYFGRLIEPAPGINIPEEQAVVRMSPHQFKTFLDHANKTLVAWEDVFGTVQQSMRTQPQDVITDGIRRLKEGLDKAP